MIHVPGLNVWENWESSLNSLSEYKVICWATLMDISIRLPLKRFITYLQFIKILYLQKSQLSFHFISFINGFYYQFRNYIDNKPHNFSGYYYIINIRSYHVRISNYAYLLNLSKTDFVLHCTIYILYYFELNCWKILYMIYIFSPRFHLLWKFVFYDKIKFICLIYFIMLLFISLLLNYVNHNVF